MIYQLLTFSDIHLQILCFNKIYAFKDVQITIYDIHFQFRIEYCTVSNYFYSNIIIDVIRLSTGDSLYGKIDASCKIITKKQGLRVPCFFDILFCVFCFCCFRFCRLPVASLRASAVGKIYSLV